MQNLRFLLLLFFCLTLSTAALRGQTQAAGKPEPAAKPEATAKTAPATADTSPAQPKTPPEFFARARQLSDLEASGIPFHLKATFTASGSGGPAETGSIEEWWQWQDKWRREGTLGAYRWVSIRNGATPDIYATSESMPSQLTQAMSAVLIKIPPEIGDGNWQIQREKVGGIDLALVSSPKGCSGGGSGNNPGCAQRDYFTLSGVLRIKLERSITTAYNEIKPFQNNLLIPRKVDIFMGTTPVLTITVDTLEPLGNDEKTIAGIVAAPHDPNLKPQAIRQIRLINVASGVSQSRIIHQVPPVYPLAAKARNIQGVVVLQAVIDESGLIKELHVIQSAGQLLDDAAMQAVRQWRYKPTVLDGVAVRVGTQISVVFTLNR